MKYAALLRPEVEPTPRSRMTPARRRRLHGLANGLCGCGCGRPVPLDGPEVRYDHFQTLEEGGLDDWPNLRPVLTAHDAPKTRGDLKRIAKGRRQRKKLSLREERPKSKRPLKGGGKLRSGLKLPKGRGFAKGPKSKIPSRSFR